MVRTETQRMRTMAEEEVIRQDPDVIGIYFYFEAEPLTVRVKDWWENITRMVQEMDGLHPLSPFILRVLVIRPISILKLKIMCLN